MAASSKDSFLFRRFDPRNDLGLLDEITDLLHRAYRPLLDEGLRYVATHQGPDTTLKRLNAGEGYLGFIGPQLAATITLVPRPYHDDCDWYQRSDVCKFTQFGVCPNHQGVGIGKNIMNRIETRARQLHARELALDTSEKALHLIRMYENWGYRHVGFADWAETNYRSVVLSKTL